MLLSLLLLLAAAGLAVRFGVLTPAGRNAVVALADGLSVGPAGRLRVEGLSGDVFGRFRLRRLRIVDARGAWLDARDVAADWRPLELLARRVHARDLRVGDLLVARAPVLEKRPPRPPQPLPVSVRLDAAAARVRTGAALTATAGDWDARGALDLLRDGRASGRLQAESRLHRGDRLALDMDLRTKARLHVLADAVEAQGGGLAGGLGLRADQPFRLHADLRSDARGGHVDVDSRSGAVTPLRAVGRWDRTGAVVDAAAVLAASSHTEHYVTRIGPEARLHLVAKPSGRLFDTDAVLQGVFATLHARGPVDVDRRRTPGMALEARIKDLSAWFKPPKVGPTTASGVLKGGWNDLRIEARATGLQLDELDTTIARLDGPLVVTQQRNEWRIVTDLVGQGVGGTGLFGALVGARPTAHVDLSRLPDGRVLFRALQVAGRYIRVDAEGAITLFGDLSFKGRFGAPSLAGLRPGAGGALDASFDAASRKGSDFWTLNVRGRGERFATGIAELDRLLGPQPTLTARGNWRPAGFTFDDVALAGVAADAQARGTYSTAHALDFALNWRARGPFAVGPLEIAGAMTGDGRLTGELARPRADLRARLSTLDLGRLAVRPADLELSFLRAPDGVMDGRLAVRGPSNYGPASAEAAFRFAPDGVDLRDIAADAGGVRVGGSLALRGDQPSAADLTVAAGPGAFLQRGRLSGTVKVTGGAGVARARLDLQGRDLVAFDAPTSLHSLELHADGPLDRLPYRLAAESTDALPWRLAGGGVLARVGDRRELSLDGAGRVRNADVRTLETARLGFGPQGADARLRLAVGGGRLSFDGRQAGDALEARGALDGVGLGAFNEDYTGAVSGALQLAGRGRGLTGRADLTLKDARARDAGAELAVAGQLHAELAGERLHLVGDLTGGQGLQAQARLELPAESSAKPFRLALARNRPLSGAVSADGELRPLWDLFVGGERTVTGQLTARAQVAGTVADPLVTGSARLDRGTVTDGAIGLSLRGLQGSADFGRNLVTLRGVSGDDGKGGRLSGEGSVSLARDGASNLQLQLQRFHLFDNEYGRATASGAVTVTRDAAGRAKLTGKLGVDRADITAKTSDAPSTPQMEVIELNTPPRTGFAAEAATRRATATAVALDVAIQAPRGVFVRGRGLDAELSLSAHVGGTTAAPDLSGVARIVRGAYDFSGKKFDFDESGVVRLGARPELIRLDLTAERDENGLDARVRITGTAARPDIKLTSIPVLPQDEILARVLFGVSASQLSPFEAAQLASAVTALATGGGLDVLGSLRQFAGLDRLALGGTAAGASISGGKYLTNNIYLELTGAGNQRDASQIQTIPLGRTGSSAQVEWRVRRNLSIIGQTWTGGDSRLSVRFRRSR